MNEPKNETKNLHLLVYCEACYPANIRVPKTMDLEEAFFYARDHLHEIPLGPLEYVPDSDNLDASDLDDTKHLYFEEEQEEKTNDTKEKIQNEEAGVCPCCGHEGLEYGTMELLDEDIAYPWSCPQCGAQGKELYHLQFEGHLEVLNADEQEAVQ